MEAEKAKQIAEEELPGLWVSIFDFGHRLRLRWPDGRTVESASLPQQSESEFRRWTVSVKRNSPPPSTTHTE